MQTFRQLFARIRAFGMTGVSPQHIEGKLLRRWGWLRSVSFALLSVLLILGSGGNGRAQETGAGAAQTTKAPVVGFLANGGPDPLIDALKRAFADAGYVEGRNIVLETAFAHGDADRLPALATELGERKAQIIISLGAIGVVAARKAVPHIPVVFAGVLDPIAAGFTTTLERPDRNVTGITTFDPQQPATQMKLLKTVIPEVNRIAILSDTHIPRTNGINPLESANERAAQQLGLSVQLLKVVGPNPDLEEAFAAMKSGGAQALVVLDVPVTILNQKRIAELARAQRLPTLFLGGQRMAGAGGLIAYGTGLLDTIPRIPAIAAKLANGARPADVPFEVITKKALILNLGTARALGITIPAELIAQADRIIE